MQFTAANLWLGVSTQNERTFGLMPVAKRDDRPTGHGRFPNTRIYREAFNRIAQAVNTLTVVPVELPWDFESRQHIYHGTKAAPMTQNTVAAGSQPQGQACAGDSWLNSGEIFGDAAAVEEGDLGSVVSVSSWAAAGTSFAASCTSLIEYSETTGEGFKLACSGGQKTFRIEFDTQWNELRFADPQTWRYALPSSISDMVDLNVFGVAAAVWTRNRSRENTYPTGQAPTQTVIGGITYNWTQPPGTDRTGVATTTTDESDGWQCRMFSLAELTGTFTLWDLLREPGFICPASFYWGMGQATGPIAGTTYYHTEEGPSRNVEVVLDSTVVGTITVPLT